MLNPEIPNEFMVNEEYQKEVIEREIVVVIEILTALLDKLQSMEDLGNVSLPELLHNQTVFAEAIISIGKFLVAIKYTIDLLQKGVEVLMERMDNLEEEEEKPQKEMNQNNGTYI
jgi:uncharacterized coiled-coil protein SlyX